MKRRLSMSILTATLLIFGLFPGMRASAEESSGSFTLRLGECSWKSGTRDFVFGPALGMAPSAFDCVPGQWSGSLILFTLDGEDPDLYDDGVFTWTTVTNGVHSLDTVPTAPLRLHKDVTVDGDTVVWSTYYVRYGEERLGITESNEPTLPPVNLDDQGGPYTSEVQMAVLQCGVGRPSMITLENQAAPSYGECESGMIDSREWGIRIDGTLPDQTWDNFAVWTHLSDGTHIATTGLGASKAFSVVEGRAYLVAHFGPDSGASVSSGSTTTGSSGSSTTTSSESAESGQGVAVLPSTGAGDRKAVAVRNAIVGASALAVLGCVGLQVRRR